MDFGRLRTKAETAKLLRISIATLDRRISDGSIEYFKVGWQILFNEQQIQSYLSKCKNGSRSRTKKIEMVSAQTI
ncbi:MAG: helix-turn-helix domain-containing protein [Acidobacteriota bacterium]